MLTVQWRRSDSAGKLAYAVWVDAPEEERPRRGIERDGEGHRGPWNRWMDGESRFLLPTTRANGPTDRAGKLTRRLHPSALAADKRSQLVISAH